MDHETPVRRTRPLKAPPSIGAAQLRLMLSKGFAPSIVDVRDAAVYHPRHIPGSILAPDSQTTALVRKLQTLPQAVLVCDDGRTSAMVAKTLGFCGFHDVVFLAGGLEAWEKAGGAVAETTRSGFERVLPEPSAPAEKTGRSLFGVLGSMLGLTSAQPDTTPTPCE